MERVLICGVNWVGDTVMAMPAVEAFRAAHPAVHLAVLVKRGMRALWSCHAAPDEVLVLNEHPWGTAETALRLRREGFASAYILPNSFRSALLPYLAGIPERVGRPGHARGRLLSQPVPLPGELAGAHQSLEVMHLLAPEELGATPGVPRLTVEDAARARVREQLEAVPAPRVALLPGAARGPSKRWPPDFFAEVGRKLSVAHGCGIVLLGTPAEQALCETVRAGVGEGCRNLAGVTSFVEWMACLEACDLVVCNDSGGMHVAAALGTPLVAVFGQTDPAKTGPLGERHTLLQGAGARSRDIARDSEAARKSLASVTPGQVYEAAWAWLERGPEVTRT